MYSIQYYISLLANKYITELSIPAIIFSEELIIKSIHENKWLIATNKYADNIILKRATK
jgi:hypothetical protein